MTLHLVTERLSLVLSGAQSPVSLLEGQSLTSLTLRGVARLPVAVQALQYGQRMLISPPGGRMVLQSRGEDAELSSLTITGEGLRLTRLGLDAGTRIGLSTDIEHHLLIDVQRSSQDRLELETPGKVTLTVKGMVVRDAQDKELPLPSSQPVHTLQVVPRGSLLLEGSEQSPARMILEVAGQSKVGADRTLPLAFVPRLQFSAPDVTREDRGKRVSAVQKFWSKELLIPENDAKQNVFLQFREQEVWTLQSVTLTGQGLECELTGYTATLMVGKEKLTNVVPSWLEYLGKHTIFQTLCKPLGIC